jgi:hypothetical protein
MPGTKKPAIMSLGRSRSAGLVRGRQRRADERAPGALAAARTFAPTGCLT